MPSASIIIPTYDRHFTLEYSVRSALLQTINDIEVIIVGDGCTKPVKEIAKRLAAEDQRVNFLDLPKAKYRGAENRDYAVKHARSERIFYNDDDDLLLKNHVETLGPFLDEVDVIDTPVISILMDGSIAVGLHDSGNHFQKRLLIDEIYKAVFDTHLAHRKSAYLKLGDLWGNAKNHRVVLSMLRSFAQSNEIAWKTIDKITAISLHGAQRVTFTEEERKSEIKQWFQKISEPDIEKYLRANASYICYYFNYILINKRLRRSERKYYFNYIQSLIDKKQVNRSINSIQLEELTLLRNLYNSQNTLKRITNRRYFNSLNEDVLIRTLFLAMSPILGGAYRVLPTIRLFKYNYSNLELLGLVNKIKCKNIRELATFHLKILSEDPKPLMEIITEKFFELKSSQQFFYGIQILDSLINTRHYEIAWRWSDHVKVVAPKSRKALCFWDLKQRIATKLSVTEEEKEEIDSIIHEFSQRMD